jgi:hypothetical protein
MRLTKSADDCSRLGMSVYVRELLFLTAAFFALAVPGMVVAGVAWYWTKDIADATGRTLVRSGLVSIAFAPIHLGPHAGIWPAVLVLVIGDPGERGHGILPLVIVWVLAMPAVYLACERRKKVGPQV